MSDAVLTTPAIQGRSLWREALERFLANRVAVASLAVLAIIAQACLIGPSFTGHAYDRVYQDYVRVPARLDAYPTREQVEAALPRLAARMRATLECLELPAALTGKKPEALAAARCGPETPADERGWAEGQRDMVRVTLASPRIIEERLLAYFERSDIFRAPRIVERSEDGRRITADVPIEWRHFLFGTDANGRDLLSRTLIAGRISLAIGLLASLVALVIGVSYGATAGYFGGRVDLLMMRLVDILYALPFIFFVILLVVFFGRNFILMFIAVGAIEWLDMARIVRGQTLSLRRQEFVQAAEALGVGTAGILKRHIVPNLLGPVVVYMTLLVPKVILLESFLSFLGLGVQEPMTSWGVLIAEGARNIQGAPWMLTFPAFFLVATLFALNAVGDGLRDALDPKER
jgi:oligopeptide transport system permease protein